jgi:hypothetical protein
LTRRTRGAEREGEGGGGGGSHSSAGTADRWGGAGVATFFSFSFIPNFNSLLFSLLNSNANEPQIRIQPAQEYASNKDKT